MSFAVGTGRIFFDLFSIDYIDEMFVVILCSCLFRTPSVHKRHIPCIFRQFHVHLTLIQQPFDHLILLLEFLLQRSSSVETEFMEILFYLDIIVDLPIVAFKEDKLH